MPKTTIRRTKIVATLGPAWERADQMHALLDAGVNVVRINASHGTPETRTRWIQTLQGVMAERDRSVAILLDLRGPRIRVGALPAPLTLVVGERVVFAPEGTAEAGDVPTTYRELAEDVKPGSRILLNDGLLACDVTEVSGERVIARVVYGGELKSNKGMNLPGVDVSAPTLSDTDREEALRAAGLGVDYIGLSFVRRAEDVLSLRQILPNWVKIVAKIEKDTALKHLEGILYASDAVMVARGDLGVELPFEQVPLVQKRLIREAGRLGKPVITATQMLESMVDASRPTRAEASDVANAILDGTDAVMLSAETAVGRFPVEAVKAMDRIAREVESHRQEGDPDAASWSVVGLHHHQQPSAGAARTEDAIAVGVCAAAELLDSPVIVCLTASGFTARTVAAYRPEVPIVAVTPEKQTFRQLALVWGVIPALVEHLPNYDRMWPVARDWIVQSGLVEPGNRVVVTAGVPFDQPGTTNLLKVETV
jgi:pyruvate kinase